MVLIVLFCLVFIAVNVINPFYVKAQMGGPNPRSLALKMGAATGYLVTGLLAMFIADNFSRFAVLIGIALILCWFGDLFLHLWGSKIFFGVGFLSFFASHFVFIAAYCAAIKATDPARGLFSVPELCAVALFDVFFILFSLKIGTDIKGPVVIPLLLYGAVITFMLCKAVELGVTLVRTGAPYAWPAAAAVAIGAACFVASDFSIALLIFNKKYKKSYPLKMFNMATYFLAVLLLSSLILFVKA